MGAHCSDEPESVAGCEDRLELVAEDLADETTTTGAGACTDGRCSPPRAASSGVGQSVGRAPTVGSLAGERGRYQAVLRRSSFPVSFLCGR